MAVLFDECFDLGDLVTRQDGEVTFDRVQQPQVLPREGKRLGTGDVAALAQELAVPVGSSFLIVSFTRLKNSSVRTTRSSREETWKKSGLRARNRTIA
jgi:hypothetical protein